MGFLFRHDERPFWRFSFPSSAERLSPLQLDKERKVATMATMGTVGIKELKNRLTHYLRRTKQGEEVVVTERGNPIALICSIKAADKAVSLETRLARLAARGLVTLPGRKPLKRVRLAKVSGVPTSKVILEERR